MTITETATDPIAHLWHVARTWLADAVAAFAAAHFDRVARRALARRLKALETLVMQLLLVEAAKLTPPVSVARASAARSGQGRAAPAPDPVRPETWRVAFQLQIPPEPPPPDSGPRIRGFGPSMFVRAIVLDRGELARFERLAAMRAQRGASGEDSERAKAEKLARRCEALRRVLANPGPRARALKRKLMALKHRAYAAALRIVRRSVPLTQQLDPIVHERARFAANRAVPAVAPPDSS